MRPATLLLVSSLSLSCIFSTGASLAAPLAGSAGTVAAIQPVAPEQLDKLLAPIALYPDPLVLQILQCSMSPEQVNKLNGWLKKNAALKGTALQDAAAAEGFEPSFVAIALFPQVVQSMADQPDWTRDLGKAFASDRNAVFASIQRLRTLAQAIGNLKSSEQQQVETVTTAGGQSVIVIQPANPQVVYVPTYNPTVVYTQPPPPPSSSEDVVVAGLVGFAAGIIIGAAIDDDDDIYYACGGWGFRGAAICEEGWEDFYEHRETMARDYYQHRENMLAQRGQNQGNRQDSRAQNQADRREASQANQSSRQDARANREKPAERPADRSGTRSGGFSGYQPGEREREASSRGRSSSKGASRGGGRRGR